MTEMYLHILFAHYGLSGNAPVLCDEFPGTVATFLLPPTVGAAAAELVAADGAAVDAAGPSPAARGRPTAPMLSVRQPGGKVLPPVLLLLLALASVVAGLFFSAATFFFGGGGPVGSSTFDTAFLAPPPAFGAAVAPVDGSCGEGLVFIQSVI